MWVGVRGVLTKIGLIIEVTISMEVNYLRSVTGKEITGYVNRGSVARGSATSWKTMQGSVTNETMISVKS